MRLSKTGRSSELNNTANAGRIVRSRNGRKILPAFLLTVFVAALATAAIPQEKNAPKLLRRRTGRRLFLTVGTIRQENRQGRGKLLPLYAAVRVRHRPYGVSRIPDPSPGGSQDAGGAFRSRVQRPGVRHRSIGAGHICPMWQRTDLAQVKRDRHTGKPRKAHSTKAFRLRQSISSTEMRRKRLSLPTGEERHLNTTTITRTTFSPCIWPATPVCVSTSASAWTPLRRSVRCVKTPSP